MSDFNRAILEGMKDTRCPSRGPRIVQIDLTGRCNNNCIGCWVHSPLIKKAPHDRNVTLPLAKARELIENISHLGAKEVFLSGAGEPFLHPDIIEIIGLIKSRGLKLNIISNFTLIDEKIIRALLDLKVDMVTASVWAALPETYIKTHPGKTEEDFYKIKESLKRLSGIKLKENRHLPHIKIYNVICNLNYAEIEKMVDFGLETLAEFMEFQIMDIIEGETSSLALSDEQVKHIKSQFDSLARHSDLCFKDLKLFNVTSSKEKELKEFPGRFVHMPQGFSLWEKINERRDPRGKHEVSRSLACPKGVRTRPSALNPVCDEENNIFTFTFPYEDCRKCAQPECPVNNEGELRIRFLSILGFASFMRRVNSTDIYNQIYEKDIIDKLPCYIGWNYSRILSTGEVIPCCKAALKPLGDISKDSFLEIWNSDAYAEFRHKATSLAKSDPYFKDINCYKSCDNVGMNLQIKELKKAAVAGERSLPQAKRKVVIPAARFRSGNLNAGAHQFGKGIVIDGGAGFGSAEYRVYFKRGARYELWSYYASAEHRPLEIYFDGRLISSGALGELTDGWRKEDLRWFKEASLEMQPGWHALKLYTKGFIPHIHSFAFLAEVGGHKKTFKGVPSEAIYQNPSSLQLLKDKIRTIGLAGSALKLFNYVASGALVKNYLDILGIFNGRYAFKGPFHVQIDLTNDCNNNCIGCWCNSPLLEEKTLPRWKKEQTLPLGLVKELIENISQMGTKEIYFSGGGEPFVHPDIMRILAYARKSGLTCYVNTNFTLMDKDKIKRLIDIGVEHLTVSSWSATPATYAATHPNKNEETFRQIRENLIYLNKAKKETPYVKLYNVIFNLNYHELKDMVHFASETGSESVEFTMIDTIPGKTDRLLLNPDQIRELQDSARQIAANLDKRGYIGKVLLFRFDSFLRRISSSPDLTKATYDRNVIDRVPCYIGWCFSRIMPNGDVNACLKAHRIPVGNLYQDDFYHIWNNEKQQYFRAKTLVYEKKDPFFRLIGNDPDIKEAGCYKSCDDVGRNIHMHNIIMSLTPLERAVLRVASKIKRKPVLKNRLKNKPKDQVLAGIMEGRRAYAGPEQAVIDITNRCNERCVGCWLYSPLLKEGENGRWLGQEMEFNTARRLIDELAELGTRRIRFTGGGEPFMHPKAMELIEYTKSKGLICCLTTNFSLLDKERVRDLIKLKVDELAVSLWASKEETYKRTHFQAQPGAFAKITENLRVLISEKKDKPFVTLCNVICSLNYSESREMFKFAHNIGADGIYFTLIDPVEGATDSLLLNGTQKQEVLRQMDEVRRIHEGLPHKAKIKLDYFDGFISRLKGDPSLCGDYDRDRVNQIPCYAGWIFSRILADGTVCPCCRGVKKPMGNINGQDFKEIWFGPEYNEFRANAKQLPKSDPYFLGIGCVKMCDNLMHNEEAASRVRDIS